MSAANPPDPSARGASAPVLKASNPRPGTWGPILLAAGVVVAVVLALIVLRLIGGDDGRSSPTAALNALTTALRDGDVAALQAASCEGWPSAAEDVAPLGAIDQAFLIDGPDVDAGQGTATIGIGDDTPRTSPSPTTSAEALALQADFDVVVGLKYVDDQWCVSSFTPTPAD